MRWAAIAGTQPLADADRPVALVVDDDPDTRRHIASVLERDGWSVRQARDGEQALLMAREHVPEIILPDLRLADSAVQKPFGAEELVAQVNRTAQRQLAPSPMPLQSV